jgi:dimethylglycine dehydrogenase
MISSQNPFKNLYADIFMPNSGDIWTPRERSCRFSSALGRADISLFMRLWQIGATNLTRGVGPMKTHVKALVVGGGAVGAGIAYHLAKAGWDTMLLERDELTSGSTWHAAGLLPLFNMSYATTHIHKYSVDFYKSLEAETGLNAGFYVVGNLRMAQTQERMDEYMLYSSVAETADVYHEFLTPAQIKERWPLVRTEDLKGALFHPQDGYINPADVTQAMAKGARQLGVTIERKWQVDGYQWTGSEWKVTCTKMVEKGGNLVPSDEQVVITADPKKVIDSYRTQLQLF